MMRMPPSPTSTSPGLAPRHWAQQGWTSRFGAAPFKGPRESVSRRLGRWGESNTGLKTSTRGLHQLNEMVERGLLGCRDHHRVEAEGRVGWGAYHAGHMLYVCVTHLLIY